MASLAQVTRETRLFLKISAIVLVIVGIVFGSTKSYTVFKQVFFPPPPPAPEAKFGKLANITFPASKGALPSEYKINNVQGTLPELPDRINVYKIKKQEATILALQSVRRRLLDLGYSEQETKITDTLYSWVQKNTQQTIKYDILTNNFDISSDYLNNEFSVGITNDKNEFIDAAKNLTSALQLDVSDIDFANSTVLYLKIQNQQLIPVEKPFEAQLVQVNINQTDLAVTPFSLFQNKIEKMKVFYPNFPSSSMYVIIGIKNNRMNIFEAHFNHQIINTEIKTTYPIKKMQEMFQELQNGKGYIINNSSSTTIDILDITPGYYIGEKPQDYTIPVIIFKGTDFIGYVPMISESSILE